MTKRWLYYLGTAQLLSNLKFLLVLYDISNDLVIDDYARRTLTTVKALAPKKQYIYRNKRYWIMSSLLTLAEDIAQINSVSGIIRQKL